MSKAIFVQPPGGYEKVSTGTVEDRDPGPGEVTVRIRACSLNYHDFVVVSGVWGPQSPRIPMADGAGEVIAIGEGVTEFAVGDSVVSTFFPTWLDGDPNVFDFSTVPGDGIDGYARETVTAAATSFTRAPEDWSHAEAATLTTAGLTAWRALFADDQLKPSDTVLVQGTGGVSIFALQFAVAAGATVIATSSSNEKLEQCQALGADHLINYREQPDWGAIALELTNGRGVDHVVDVGGPATIEQSLQAVRVGGHISLIGILSGVEGKLPFVTALMKQARLQGVLVGSRQHQIDMVKGLNSIGIRPVIDRAFPLEEIVDAFQYQESNKHFGKIVLEV